MSSKNDKRIIKKTQKFGAAETDGIFDWGEEEEKDPFATTGTTDDENYEPSPKKKRHAMHTYSKHIPNDQLKSNKFNVSDSAAIQPKSDSYSLNIRENFDKQFDELKNLKKIESQPKSDLHGSNVQFNFNKQFDVSKLAASQPESESYSSSVPPITVEKNSKSEISGDLSADDQSTSGLDAIKLTLTPEQESDWLKILMKMDEKLDELVARVKVLEKNNVKLLAKSGEIEVKRDEYASIFVESNTESNHFFMQSNALPFEKIDDLDKFEEKLQEKEFFNHAVSHFNQNHQIFQSLTIFL